MLGGAGSDRLAGGEGDDTLDGGDGDDQLFGDSGNDRIVGGRGGDFISGGDGNDILADGQGRDNVRGDSGDDYAIAAADAADDDDYDGGTGHDTLDYSAATKTIIVKLADETAEGVEIGLDSVANFESIIGGSGDDHLSAGGTYASLDGGAGHDTITGGPGDDTLKGGDGNDIIADGAGSDSVQGGAGDDYVTAAADAADDDYDGGPGRDTLDYSAAASPIVVSLADETAEGVEIGLDSVVNFEGVIGGSGDDHLLAGASSASLNGGAGDDRIDGSPGDDFLKGNDGNDVIAGGAGSDIVHGDDGNDHVIAAADAVPDSYDGGDGHDTLNYSVATLSIRIDLGSGTAVGAEIGRDLIANFERVIGGSGDDTVLVGANPVSITGGGGNNTYEFVRKDDDHQPDVVHKITDFNVGDRIFTATYQIYYRDEEDAADEVADLFKDIYLSDGEDRRPIRFRFEEQDDDEVTLIEVHDRPDNIQDFFSIQLSGHHELQYILSAS